MSTSMQTRYGRETYALIFTHQLNGSQLSALCKRLSKDADRTTQNDPYTMKEKLLSGDLSLLHAAITTIRPAVAKEYFDSGVKYLMGKVWTPTGRRRQTDEATKFSDQDIMVLGCAHEIAVVDVHYEFTKYRTLCLPVFEVRSRYGEFRYYSTSWQSGGVFQILKHA